MPDGQDATLVRELQVGPGTRMLRHRCQFRNPSQRHFQQTLLAVPASLWRHAIDRAHCSGAALLFDASAGNPVEEAATRHGVLA